MILQKIVFDESGGKTDELYVRSFGAVQVKNGKIWIPKKAGIRTDTYMNAFDIDAWRRYTCISEAALTLRVKGKGELKIFRESQGEAAVCLTEKCLGEPDGGDMPCGLAYRFPIEDKLTQGVLYFEFWAKEDTLLEAAFETAAADATDIKLSLVICTYRRQAQLEQLLRVIQTARAGGTDGAAPNSVSDSPNAQNDSWLRTIVVDNASELEDKYGKGIRVCRNPNTGGSGGFARGMEETVKGLRDFPASHVVLMDDDVVLSAESLYRLRALLTYLKEEYRGEAIAGRMFRMDKPYIQYTAAEIWNGGDIRHIGWNQDMTEKDCLWSMNRNEGAEYGGWWLACYPVEFVKENRPLPFFLHCDDVEYGLRHGGTPIILNGIQVWHETYEYRQSPVTAYYDMRNTLFVNEIYGSGKGKEQVLDEWKRKIAEQHIKKDYLMEYMLICGMRDYCRKKEWLNRLNSERWQKKICRTKTNRLQNAIVWRLVRIRYLVKSVRQVQIGKSQEKG